MTPNSILRKHGTLTNRKQRYDLQGHPIYLGGEYSITINENVQYFEIKQEVKIEQQTIDVIQNRKDNQNQIKFQVSSQSSKYSNQQQQKRQKKQNNKLKCCKSYCNLQ